MLSVCEGCTSVECMLRLYMCKVGLCSGCTSVKWGYAQVVQV